MKVLEIIKKSFQKLLYPSIGIIAHNCTHKVMRDGIFGEEFTLTLMVFSEDEKTYYRVRKGPISKQSLEEGSSVYFVTDIEPQDRVNVSDINYEDLVDGFINAFKVTYEEFPYESLCRYKEGKKCFVTFYLGF